MQNQNTETEMKRKITYEDIRYTAPYGMNPSALRGSVPGSAGQTGGNPGYPTSLAQGRYPVPGASGPYPAPGAPGPYPAPGPGAYQIPVPYRGYVPYQAAYSPAPVGEKSGRIRAWMGVLFFIIVMVLFYFVLPIPIYALGIPDLLSVIIQQLFLLAASVLFVLIVKEDLRRVFPVRKPNLSGVLGIIVIYAGIYLLNIALSSFLAFAAGDQLQEIQDAMFGDISGIAYVIYLIMIAVLPAFCEEALNRGVVLYGLKNDLKSRTLIILISGTLFGVSHFYPVRMLVPAILGFIMAWIMLETDNLFYTGLLHMMNNGAVLLISEIAKLLLPAGALEESASMAESIGGLETGLAMIMYGLFAPVIIYCGCYLIRKSSHGEAARFVEPGKGRSAVLSILLPDLAIIAAAAAVMILG